MCILKRSFLVASLVATTVLTATAAETAAPMPNTLQAWWPDRLDLGPLRQGDPASTPYAAGFDYAAEFNATPPVVAKNVLRFILMVGP